MNKNEFWPYLSPQGASEWVSSDWSSLSWVAGTSETPFLSQELLTAASYNRIFNHPPKKPSHFTRKIQAAINRKTKVHATSNNRASVCFSGSISDVISLHKEHRIVGKLIGCPAKTPHQSVADGLPLVLSAPEITGLWLGFWGGPRVPNFIILEIRQKYVSDHT